jgi:hypothetical protein
MGIIPEPAIRPDAGTGDTAAASSRRMRAQALFRIMII